MAVALKYVRIFLTCLRCPGVLVLFFYTVQFWLLFDNTFCQFLIEITILIKAYERRFWFKNVLSATLLG